MYYDEIAEEVERRVKAELRGIYRPSGNDETSAWKRNIIDVLAERFSKQPVSN